ncbi:hypothetical protein FQV39_15690 [Bosea sp. F3-2]|uniref:hypothetical protein n=1 Tax=Bosea sp. F3-2 TaxID=2599640 RepID=UPI0011EEA406|nr:hypothetical protein [Bosea sp. F3-2]QEL23853.1 hypothetical protein FQV39_15690 [Bosea sp. F3-2]
MSGYLSSDPRSQLSPQPAAKAAPVKAYAGADYARFYAQGPQQTGKGSKTWLARGQNFIVAYSDVEAGAALERASQQDEYCLILPEKALGATVSAGSETVEVPGGSIVFVPPGASRVTVAGTGRLIRIFSSTAPDLAAACSNAASYAEPHANVALLAPWPEPRGGWKIRAYSLDAGGGEGRFGRIFRCTTLMVNILDPRMGLRDITALSPHHHDDFEQGSLVIDGGYIHDIRWPWTPDMRIWREDEHELMAAPSLTVIPPPSIHTSRSVLPGLNQMIDIFSPPRLDFSQKPGWVINAADYPMPGETA